MEIQGNVMKVGQLQKGTGQNGEWQRQDYVIEYFEHETDMWTQKIIVSLMGDHIKQNGLQVGDKVKVRFGLNYQEYQGRFYQQVRLAQDGLQVISRLGQQETTTPQATTPPTAQPTIDLSRAQELKPAQEIAQPEKGEVKGDDLPF